MKKLFLSFALATVATVAACTSPTEVLCLREVTVVDSVTNEPITDITLYRQCEDEPDEDTAPAIHPPR